MASYNHPCTPLRSIIAALLLISFFLPVYPGLAKGNEQGGGLIMNHVKDAHAWHLATLRGTPVTIPLPIIICSPDRGIETFSSSRFFDTHHRSISYQGYRLDADEKIIAVDKDRVFYDLSITKNVAYMLINVLLLSIIVLAAARNYQHRPQAVPRGGWALLELLICFVRDEIAIPNIGPKKYEQFMPYLLSVFFFIWLNNLLGLLPGAANVTGNISITLVLALFTFVITNTKGSKHYWKHVFNTPGIPRWLAPIMVPVELLGLFTKPFSLMIRLFANITAGHVILISIISLIFILKNVLVGAISVPFGAFMLLLKLLVAFLQAYIFTLLSSIYFGAAVESHEKEAINNLPS